MRPWFVGMCVMMLVATTGFCITDEVMWEQFEFNFATPGARANAMGRAFVALADDATAASTNPAGLVLLTRPEVSFENKSTQFISERPAAPDSLSTGETVDFGDSVNSPAFASFVYPHRNLRLAVFRQEFLNYREEYRLEKRVVPDTDRTLFQVDGDLRFRGVNWGVATAYRFSPSFFAGFSLRASQLSIRAVHERENRSGPNTAIDGDSLKVSFGAGIIWNPDRKVSVGAFYERNARHRFEETYQKRDGSMAPPIRVDLKVPDRIAAGVALRITEGFTLVSDVVRVQYSQLSDRITILFNDESTTDDFRIRDATEFHAGAEEIFFVRSAAVVIRGGVFTNPPHRLRYSGSEIPADATFNFGRGDEGTAVSLTLGGGVSIDATQIDAAYIFSDTFDEFSVSFVLRF